MKANRLKVEIIIIKNQKKDEKESNVRNVNGFSNDDGV